MKVVVGINENVIKIRNVYSCIVIKYQTVLSKRMRWEHLGLF